MMKKRIKAKKQPPLMKPQVRVTEIPIKNEKHRQQIFMDLAVSSEFDMRHRGVFEYYGKDLIAYKREKPSDQDRNEFLRIFSKFMTDCLEDNCPSSWKHCQPSFWEELIYTFYPHTMRISPDEKFTENFLGQLLTFVRWLDKQNETSHYPIVENYALTAISELKTCERLLNALFLINYPRIFHEDWDYEADQQRMIQELDQCVYKRYGLFEVTNMDEDSVILTKFNSKKTYIVEGLPSELMVPGMTLMGMFGKYRRSQNWHWYFTEGVYPPSGKRFITVMPANVPVIKNVCLVDPITSI
jgi:hypothetical protein